MPLFPLIRLETDIHQGVSDADVAKRRQVFGWNELEAPDENLFLKFLTFFKGPILYGEHFRSYFCRLPVALVF